MLTAVLLAACAAGPELKNLRAADAGIELSKTPFFPQQIYQCGPAALATVLNADGVVVTPEQLSPQMYLPARHGSLQAELIAATRRHQRVPYLLPGKLSPILQELRQGRPVLLLQNLGLDSLPIWHYAVLVGFDPNEEQFILRSGDQPRRLEDARDFLASWDRAGRWSLVVTPVDKPPASANVNDWLRATAAFESLGQLNLAAQAYQAAVRRWPASAQAWVALGNVEYRRNKLPLAKTHYEHALQLDTQNWVARNNLLQTLIDLNCPDYAAQWLPTAATPPADIADNWLKTLQRLKTVDQQSCGLD